MDDDQKRALEVFESVAKENKRDHLTAPEMDANTRDINLMASKSKRVFVKYDEAPLENLPSLHKPEPSSEPEPNPDFASFIGKTFVRRAPGIYIGAKYYVKADGGEHFLIVRIDPANMDFEFTMKKDLFHRLMELPKEPEKPKDPPPPKPPPPASPWAEKGKKK